VAIDPVRDVALWRWDLSGDAFGASPPQEDPDGDGQVFRLDLRFPGQRFDAASGLYHNYFRDYDPTVGRYVQSDPIGLLGGMSTYGYANHSPATFSDPMGLFGKKIGGGIANMLVRPIVQGLGGGVAARAASAAAHARAQARRAAEMAQRMQTVLGRILKGRSRKGGEPAGCDDLVNFTRVAGSASNHAHSAALFAKYKEILSVSEKANPLVVSLIATGRLPSNFITKQQAIGAGWKPGKALDNYVPGGQLGGDVFENTTGVLPSAPGRIWYEADVGLSGTMSRANQPGTRLLYSNDGQMYITADHYSTVYPFGGP
jgi:filamentous hemagglutinin